jgi:hypothetical protein
MYAFHCTNFHETHVYWHRTDIFCAEFYRNMEITGRNLLTPLRKVCHCANFHETNTSPTTSYEELL